MSIYTRNVIRSLLNRRNVDGLASHGSCFISSSFCIPSDLHKDDDHMSVFTDLRAQQKLKIDNLHHEINLLRRRLGEVDALICYDAAVGNPRRGYHMGEYALPNETPIETAERIRRDAKTRHKERMV